MNKRIAKSLDGGIKMSVAKAYDKCIYELECSYDAAVSYEERAVDGMIAMKIIHVLDTKTASFMLDYVSLKTNKTRAYVISKVKEMTPDIRKDYFAGRMTSEEFAKLLVRMIALLEDMKKHTIKDEELIREHEY